MTETPNTETTPSPEDGLWPSSGTDTQPTSIQIPAKVSIALCSTMGLDSAAFLSRKQFALARFAEILNGLQDCFEFRAIDQRWNLGKYDKLHIYTDEHYYERLRDVKQEQEFDYAIAITNDDLERSVFNTHCESEGVGIITVSHYLDYMPPGGTLHRYLAFLVLCETLCLVGKHQFEHLTQTHCLFDMCRDKRDLTSCLSRPKIEDKCERVLRKTGFTEEHLTAAYTILAYVGTPSAPQIALSGIREPGAGFLLGVATTLGAAILITICVTAAEALFAASALIWVMALYFMALRGRPRSPRRASWLTRLRTMLSRQ